MREESTLILRILFMRHVLFDELWKSIEPLGTGKASDFGRTTSDHRRFVENMVVIIISRISTMDLPERFGFALLGLNAV